ncbi:MFS transporter-like protein [Phaeosphaeriaceae sp. PMI808]|nr:MFS transporter-like protein [Phaeosphaeriaceae sp. PMI808]
MGLGILDDRKLEHVPGTALVLDGVQRRAVEENVARGTGLKYDKTNTILLVPQPSDDVNDPLNWPIWKRDVIIFVLSLAAVLASTLSPILAANTVSLAIYFGRNLTDMALLTGYHLLAVGLAGFLFVPSARIWGKRHVYLLGMMIVIVSCAWGGATGNNYKSFLWARIFQGIGLAPFEALVNASVGDLYHVHQRGTRMALSNFCVFGGSFFTPVLVGVIANNIGYQWSFYFVAIFTAALFPLVVIFVPETAYKRDAKFDIDTMGNLVAMDGSELTNLNNTNKPVVDGSQSLLPSDAQSDQPVADTSSDNKPSNITGQTQHVGFMRRLAPFNGRKTDERYLHLLLRPFALFLHPGILWACLIQGTLIGFTVLIGIVLAAIMLGPPLWFGEVKTGYMYTGAFIGALLGFALTGAISDWSARALTRANGGVYEPEFRLVLVIPQLILGGAGIIGFGYTSADALRYGWIWPDFFFALVVMGMVCGAVASALYIVDAHRDMAIEAFTCLLVFKNIFAFALTFKGFDWIVEAGRKGGGVKEVFVTVGCVQVGICALSIPMYIFGKRNRSYFFRHNVFFKATDWVADRLTFW